jgi:HAD superfamily phosphoserine phosphatase-like hydrolase
MAKAHRLDVDIARVEAPGMHIVPRAYPIPISIFDLDRTLTRHGTYTPFLLFAAWHLAPWRTLLLPVMIFGMIAYKCRLIGRCQLKALQHALLLGRSLPRHRVDTVARKFAAQLHEHGILKAGLARIAQERAEGRRVMLATAANGYYLEAIADRIGISDIVATRSTWHGDTLLPAIDGENCYGMAKRRMTMAFLKQKDLDRASVHLRFFSDHISDCPTFEWVDEPIAVNPSPKLATFARQRGWEVLDWK